MKRFESLAGLDSKHVVGQDKKGNLWLGTLNSAPYPETSMHFVPVIATMQDVRKYELSKREYNESKT